MLHKPISIEAVENYFQIALFADSNAVLREVDRILSEIKTISIFTREILVRDVMFFLFFSALGDFPITSSAD